jgi:hypothetical protein
MKERNSTFCILILFLFFSCKKEGGSKDDSSIRFQLYQLEKIGWKSRVHTQKIDDIGFTATEVPIQYYLVKNLGTENLFDIDSLYQANKRERVVEFSFIQEEEKDLLEEQFTKRSYQESVKYMSFGIDHDFSIVTSKKDTIKCSGVNYERNYKVAPFQKIILYFSDIDPNEKIQLIYNDQLFGKGIIKFKFKDKYTDIKL